MLLLILDSLGSTELFFILLMALVFFGPRKLPQLSRSLGKNLAEFRKASEDFKRTWEREVAFEESQREGNTASRTSEHNLILNSESPPGQIPEPMIEPVSAGGSIGREPTSSSEDSSAGFVEADDSRDASIKSEQTRKQDWL